MEIDPLELAVITKLLDGRHPVLDALREQLVDLRVSKRELTGAGFYTEFETSSAHPRAATQKDEFQFGDVDARIDGLESGAGFLLYIRNGVLHMLEGYSYEEPWPAKVDKFELTYSNPDRSTELERL